jgi:predicted metal-dependent hydrolase
MRVFPGGRVEIVVPPGVGVPAVERFVARHRDWAERRARELTLAAPSIAERRPAFIDLAVLERRWRVDYSLARRAACSAMSDGTLKIALATDSDAEVSDLLLRWLTTQANEHLAGRLADLSRETGIGFERLQLRRQRTRWGSCSSAGAISLNVCLMFQRPAVVRYLLIHELCHRLHMNHSRRFWGLVETFEPNWRPLDAELLNGWRNVPAWVFP